MNGTLHDLAQSAIRPTAAFGLEHFKQFGIALIAFGGIKHGSQKTSWRLIRCRRVEIEAQSRENIGHIAFKCPPLLLGNMAGMELYRPLNLLILMVLFNRHRFLLFLAILLCAYSQPSGDVPGCSLMYYHHMC